MVAIVSGPPAAATVSPGGATARFADRLGPTPRQTDFGGDRASVERSADARASGCGRTSQASAPPSAGAVSVRIEPGANAGATGSLPSRALREVQLAQARLDQILKLAESGRSFSPAELIALQAHAYRAGQELELAGKVVEKGLSAVKQTLQTQL